MMFINVCIKEEWENEKRSEAVSGRKEVCEMEVEERGRESWNWTRHG